MKKHSTTVILKQTPEQRKKDAEVERKIEARRRERMTARIDRREECDR